MKVAPEHDICDSFVNVEKMRDLSWQTSASSSGSGGRGENAFVQLRQVVTQFDYVPSVRLQLPNGGAKNLQQTDVTSISVLQSSNLIGIVEYSKLDGNKTFAAQLLIFVETFL